MASSLTGSSLKLLKEAVKNATFLNAVTTHTPIRLGVYVSIWVMNYT